MTRTADCVVLKHGFLRSIPPISASGSIAQGVARGRMAGGEHVGGAVAAAGGPGSKRRDLPGRRRRLRRGLDRAVLAGLATAGGFVFIDTRLEIRSNRSRSTVPGVDGRSLGGWRARRRGRPQPGYTAG